MSSPEFELSSPDDLVIRATEYAKKVHASHKYGERPYETHLTHVADVLRRFGHFEPELLAAAWLHDVIEDVGVAHFFLEEEFGSVVADLVWAVTNEPGTRKQRLKATLEKIRAAGSKAICLKLADRIANVEYSIAEKTRHFRTYREEYSEFRTLRVEGEHDEMWKHLDELCS